MKLEGRPSFGVVTSTATVTTPQTENKEFRKELGAIWSRESSKTNTQFFSIKMTLTKEMLKQLSESPNDEVSFSLVAFPNKNKDGQSNRPDYRIFEEKKRD